MRHVTANFVPPAGSTARQGSWGHAALTRHTCLAQNVERMHCLGFDRGAALDVVLVGDLSDVPDSYVAGLRDHGAEVHVATDLYLRLADEFPNVVSRFAGPYGIFSFGLLRWLLVDALFPGEEVACYDGDVMLSMPLMEIAAAIEGRTGTATSTAFVTVSDRGWFESWRRNLERLEQDMEGFWRSAAEATGFAALPAVYRYSAEEYFAKALIESGELPQDLEPALPGCWLLAQPQYLPRLYAYTRSTGSSHAPTPLRYRREAGLDHLNDRPVAFWHLQKPFLGLLGVANARPLVGLGSPDRVRPLDFYGFAATDEWVRMADEYLKEFPYPFDPYYDEAPYPLDPVDDEERRVLRRFRRSMQQRHGFGPDNPFSLAAICERSSARTTCRRSSTPRLGPYRASGRIDPVSSAEKPPADGVTGSLPDTSFDAILVVSFGGPEGMDDVRPFLENVTRGRSTPPERLEEVVHHYELFDGVSPINAQSRALIDALAPELARHGIDLPIYLGNRNWHPFLTDTIREMAGDGVRRALALFTTAFSSYSSCRQYRENIVAAQDEVGPDAPEVAKIRAFFNHPGFVAANVDHVTAALETIPAARRERAHLAFTAHSIPLAMARKSRYEQQLAEASRLVAEHVGAEEHALVYQSRSGPPQVPWLVPDVCDHVRALAERGVTDAVLSPIGFVSDHMEILYDLDVEARTVAEEVGVNLVRARTAGTHPAFVAMIRELVEERLDAAVERRALGSLGPSHDVCLAGCCLPS